MTDAILCAVAVAILCIGLATVVASMIAEAKRSHEEAERKRRALQRRLAEIRARGGRQ